MNCRSDENSDLRRIIKPFHECTAEGKKEFLYLMVLYIEALNSLEEFERLLKIFNDNTSLCRYTGVDLGLNFEEKDEFGI